MAASAKSDRATLALDAPPRLQAAGRAVHGQTPVERYRFADQWSLHHYRYRAVLELDGRAHPIRPGAVSLVPPRVRMVYRFPRPGCRHDYGLFIPGRAVGRPPAGSGEPVAVWSDAAALGPAFLELFDRVIDEHGLRPRRAEAALWEMLWRLGDGRRQHEAAAGDPAEVVASRIRARLGETLRVADLAEEVGLSHNQLTRRFRARFGTTVVAYIRQRRLAAAERMLRHTTLPVKVIAMEVGLPDAHQFNKAVRLGLGGSPTRIRAQG